MQMHSIDDLDKSLLTIANLDMTAIQKFFLRLVKRVHIEDFIKTIITHSMAHFYRPYSIDWSCLSKGCEKYCSNEEYTDTVVSEKNF